jgi:DNA-binding beta-propeller fold protein YncE
VNACDGDFADPWAVAVDAKGNIYVAGFTNDRIQKFDSRGNYLDKWGIEGSGNGQLDGPEGVAIAPSGTIYVADGFNDRIQYFNEYGFYLGQWGSYGTGDTQFREPAGVAVDSAGYIYVTDHYNDRVVKYAPGGIYQTKWGVQCQTSIQGEHGCDGDFYHPWGIAVDSSDNVYVADAFNHRIEKFTNTGTVLAKWGTECDTGTEGVDGCDGKFNTSAGVAIDGSDNLYVVDYYNNRVQKFDSNGAFLAKWGTFDFGPGAEAGKFYNPTGVAVDAEGNIYVTESGNNRVQKFGPALDTFIGEPPVLLPLPR